MQGILLYIIKWSICIGILYIPFILLLRKEKLATFNRRLLLCITVAAAILPAIELRIPVHRKVSAEFFAMQEEFERFTPQLQGETYSTPAVTKDTIENDSIVTNREKITAGTLFTWNNFATLYILGVAVSLFLALAEMIRISGAIKKGTLWIEKRSRMTIYCHANSIAPFSWFGKVAISENDYKNYGNEILLHEEGHIRQRHSWDMLFIRLVKALQWFNPFIYILASDLKEIHEFEADEYVLKHHGDAQAYQLLILKKATEGTMFNIANSFSYKSVRHRIEMMIRKKRGGRRYKAVYIAPATILCIALFAKPHYIYSISTGVQQQEERGSEPEKVMAIEESAAVSADTNGNNIAGTIPATEKSVVSIPAEEHNSAIREITETAAEACAGESGYTHLQPLAAKKHYEYIDIEPYIENRCDRACIIKCSTKVLFICDKYGRAYSIKPMGNSFVINGGSSEELTIANEAGTLFTEAATEYINSKEWQPSTVEGKRVNTYIEAYIIFTAGDNSQDSRGNVIVGTRPVEQ
ncbi:MAG: M56 family metallopeptidase [Bacteroidales bacterium]|nr:M56 family metallopeptidase [Bacteroidales bacterium]